MNIREIALKCSKCGYCSVCPTYRIVGWESVSPRGKIQVALDFLNGNISLDSRIVKDIFKCSVCGLCEEVCPVDLPLIDFWEDLRYLLTQQGYAPLSVHRKLKEITYRNFNPYSGDQERRGEWVEFEVRPAKTLYFAGCTASFRLQNLAKSTANALNKLGIEFTVAGKNEYCCGSPFLRTGQRDIVEKLFEKNYRYWEKNGIERIITSCPGCYRTISLDYPKIAEKKGYEFNIEVVHTVSILNKEGNFKKIGIKGTYHDPCHLGRHMGMYEEPRNVIRKLGVDFVEMERNRERSLCCGAGGGLRSQFGEVSFEIGRQRVLEAMETGADYLITCCPFCEYHLSKSAEKLGGKIKVVDLVEIAERLISP
ncbi:(Fe-S)-binding protein [Archaeoglobus neptunius]|uniref:(Fe-S)-binding protein n=1 Tax=Archaeoglobus neptunius TaxID=2798580 RepID=UPI0019286102|nr:(Fe-S)-binding protein [Archaeoglobus neptunius]